MTQKITLEQILDDIEKNIEQDQRTTIHFYDYGKKDFTALTNTFFDVTIRTCGKTTSYELDMQKENAYDVLFEALRDIYPNMTTIYTNRIHKYSAFSVQLTIANCIGITFDFATKQGQEWMSNIYKQYH